MTKWFGKVRYSETVETVPGRWESVDTTREYFGDVKRNSTRWAGNPNSVNDDLTINTQISIVADPFALDKFYSMKWIEYMGSKWKITNVEPQFPRLVITLGGVYNG